MKNQIEFIQFDPNGYCNAKCWFCPVKYEKLPPHKNMNIHTVRLIFNKICNERDKNKIVSKDVFIYSAHYNEILLYPYLEDFLKILQEKKLKTVILSNGINLSPKKLNLLTKYSDIISGINLNIPSIEENSWILQVGLNKKYYDKLIDNLNYIYKNIPPEIDFSIGMNGISEKYLLENKGYIGLLNNFPDFIEIDTLEQQFKTFKEKYPKFNIYKSSLIDRHNILEKNKIYSLRIGNLLRNKKDKQKIINCDNGIEKYGGRFYNWLHINCYGDVFLCCHDYNYEYIFGNIINQELKEIWESKKRKDILKKAKNNICQTCINAIWK